MSDKIEFNRRAAKSQAEKLDFNPEDMLFCSECGRTVIRNQKIGNPGFKDSIYCTCNSIGYPMVKVIKDE